MAVTHRQAHHTTQETLISLEADAIELGHTSGCQWSKTGQPICLFEHSDEVEIVRLWDLPGGIQYQVLRVMPTDRELTDDDYECVSREEMLRLIGQKSVQAQLF